MPRLVPAEPQISNAPLIGPGASLTHHESPHPPIEALLDDPSYGLLCDNLKSDPALDELFNEEIVNNFFL